MAPTFTKRGRVLRQETGTNRDIWGEEQNAGSFDRDDDMWGTVEIAVNAPVVLTANDGMADEARSFAIICTGAGGHPVSTPSGIDKPYVVVNDCVADITFGPNGGAKATVRAGTKAVVVIEQAGMVARALDPTLDQILPAEADISMGGNRVTNLADAVADTDAISKGQAAAQAIGLVEPFATAAAASAAAALLSEGNAANSESAAALSEGNAAAAETKAIQWAEQPEDVPVEPGKFSARHYASKAAKSAEDAALFDPSSYYTKTQMGPRNGINGYLGLDAEGEIPAAIRSSIFPIGTMLAATEAPGPGWMKADGSTYLNSAYPELAKQLGPRPRFVSATSNAVLALGGNQQSQLIIAKNMAVSLQADRKLYSAPVADWSTAASYTQRLDLSAHTYVELALCKDDDTLFVIYHSVQSSVAGNIFFRWSTDGGVTWSAQQVWSTNSSFGTSLRLFRQGIKVAEGLYVLAGSGLALCVRLSPFAVISITLSIPAWQLFFMHDGSLCSINPNMTVVRYNNLPTNFSSTTLPGFEPTPITNNMSGAGILTFEEKGVRFAVLLGYGSAMDRAMVGYLYRLNAAGGATRWVFEHSFDIAWPGTSGNRSNPDAVVARPYSNADNEVTGNLLLLSSGDGQVVMLFKQAGQAMSNIGVIVPAVGSTTGATDLFAPVELAGGVLALNDNGSPRRPARLMYPAGYDPSAMFYLPSRDGDYIKAEN